MTGPNEEQPVDAEDPIAELAAESTQDSTPSKSLYGDGKTQHTPTREPGRDRNPEKLPPAKKQS